MVLGVVHLVHLCVWRPWYLEWARWNTQNVKWDEWYTLLTSACVRVAPVVSRVGQVDHKKY